MGAYRSNLKAAGIVPAYKTIISDEAQTLARKVFRERQLNEACQRGYTVVMVDERGTVSACSDYEHFVDWFSDPRQQNGWNGGGRQPPNVNRREVHPQAHRYC